MRDNGQLKSPWFFWPLRSGSARQGSPHWFASMCSLFFQPDPDTFPTANMYATPTVFRGVCYAFSLQHRAGVRAPRSRTLTLTLTFFRQREQGEKSRRLQISVYG